MCFLDSEWQEELEQHYGLLNMGLQIQRRVHLRLHQEENRSSENNRKRFRNVKKFTRIVRSVPSSMVDTYENGISFKVIDAQETGLGLI